MADAQPFFPDRFFIPLGLAWFSKGLTGLEANRFSRTFKTLWRMYPSPKFGFDSPAHASPYVPISGTSILDITFVLNLT
ncbi:MAG: hypothetical protein B7Z26_07130 [Asticcacaulis sp. 32-58-5]|nr:MAG: hypothetical protein B7Z26_07130 [Asticcacaulis sp. 32-58-5]